MARPRENGLRYFPLDVDFHSDSKIRILRARYKNDGVYMYIFLLSEIYKNGYYLKIDDDYEYILSDEVGCDINKVKQVLNFLSKRSLFDNKLFDSDKVLTSAGIQRRYQLAKKDAARKSKEPLNVGRYWLLSKEETEPFIKCSLFEDVPGKTDNYSGNNQSNSMEKSLKESKVNNKEYIPAFGDKSLESAFQFYLIVRSQNWGEVSEEQIQAMREELLSMSGDVAEQTAIVKKATAGGWKNFYPINKGRKKKEPAGLIERDYDMDSLEVQLLKAQETGGKEDGGKEVVSDS